MPATPATIARPANTGIGREDGVPRGGIATPARAAADPLATARQAVADARQVVIVTEVRAPAARAVKVSAINATARRDAKRPPLPCPS